LPRHIVCLTFDFDTQSGFIARGMMTPTPLSRGEFGLVGARRILALLKDHGLRATWFIPGFTIESHPAACDAVVQDGHEVAHHSWAHVPPAQQTRAEEEADLIRANEAVEKLTGRKARGYRSPSWDLSESTIDLLLAHGFRYDSSLMGADYWPYRARRGDVAELGKPFRFGAETSLIEMQPARSVMENWLDEFRYMQQSVEWGVLTYTMHPYVIGRGYRMLALEDLIKKLKDMGAMFMTMEDAAAEAQAKMF